MNAAYLLLAILASSVEPSPSERTVIDLVEAAHREDSAAIKRLAPNATFFVGDVGHPLTSIDISKCCNYQVSASATQKAAVQEWSGPLRELPAIKVRFDCDGVYELTFGIESGRVIGGYVSIYGRSPSDG